MPEIISITDSQNGAKSIASKNKIEIEILSSIFLYYTLYFKIQIKKLDTKYNEKLGKSKLTSLHKIQ